MRSNILFVEVDMGSLKRSVESFWVQNCNQMGRDVRLQTGLLILCLMLSGCKVATSFLTEGSLKSQDFDHVWDGENGSDHLGSEDPIIDDEAPVDQPVSQEEGGLPSGSLPPESPDQSATEVLPVGPYWKAMPLTSQAQYDSGLSGGEGMQMIRAIEYAPSNPDVVYFSVDTSQVWKSVDGGTSWVSKRVGYSAQGGLAIGVDPLNENVVFVSGCFSASSLSGIYRSLNGGDSWSLVKETIYKQLDFAHPVQGDHYAFDPNSFNGTQHMTIYAATNGEGVMKSVDGGTTWKTLALAGSTVLDTKLHRIGSTVTLYVTTTNGIKKIVEKSDGSVATSSLGTFADYSVTIELNPQASFDQDILYVAARTEGIYKSTNGGASFFAINNGVQLGQEFRFIQMSPANSNVLFVKASDLNPYYSTDAGATWSQSISLDQDQSSLFSRIFPARALPLALHPKDSAVAIGTFWDGAPRKTIDGGKNWFYSGHGYMGGRRGHNKSSISFHPQNQDQYTYFLLDYGPFSTTNNGASFSKVNLGVRGLDIRSSPAGDIHPTNRNIIVTSGGFWASHTLLRSSDGGRSWSVAKDSNGADITGDFHYTRFNPNNPNYVYVGGEAESWISDDTGLSWRKLAGKSIHLKATKNGDILFAVEGNNLLRSDDRGTNWRVLTALPGFDLRDIDIDPDDANRIYVASSQDFYVWNGQKWTPTGLAGGLTSQFKRSLAPRMIIVDPTNGNNIYVGIRDATYAHRHEFVFQSSDRGETWSSARYNLPPNSSVESMGINPHNGQVHLCTSHGNFLLINE